MPQKIANVAFMDGAAGDEKVRLFLAADLQTGNFNLTRLFVFRQGGEWHYFDFPSVVVSVSLAPESKGLPKQYVALGRDGVIFYAQAGNEPTTENIADAGTGGAKYGYLARVRFIGDSFYACGHRGQVYRRTSHEWVHIDDGILERTERALATSHNGIDGTSPSDIYVVGDYGRIFHFDGKRWSDVSFATNVHLESVRCVSRDQVYVCGDKGLVLRGNRDGWTKLFDPEPKGDLWDLEMYHGQLFLAVDESLAFYNGDEIVPVVTGLAPEPRAYRFSKNQKVLWSIGETDLVCYDGRKWSRILHPDNQAQA